MSSTSTASTNANELTSVVFIAGANWSGSTVTGAVLGASDSPFEYFHLGEVHSIFEPHHQFFGDPRFAAHLTAFWHSVDHKVGAGNAYAEIQKHANSRILIDSSKAIVWLKAQRAACERLGIPLLPVVTFRSFAAIVNSALNRDRGVQAAFRNVGYYQRLFESGLLRDNWIAVDAEALVRDPPAVTQSLCAATGIPYFAGKENYWNYPLVHLSGSGTQRRHIKYRGRAGYSPMQVRGEELPPGVARKLEQSGLLAFEHRLRERAIPASRDG